MQKIVAQVMFVSGLDNAVYSCAQKFAAGRIDGEPIVILFPIITLINAVIDSRMTGADVLAGLLLEAREQEMTYLVVRKGNET